MDVPLIGYAKSQAAFGSLCFVAR